MSPLIEEARQRQRRRRLALAAVLVVAVLAAGAVALLRRTPDRQAQPKPQSGRPVLMRVAGGYVVSPRLTDGGAVEPVLQSVVASVARRYARSHPLMHVHLDPATGKVTVLTTPAR